jgi:hypothetical protein
MADESSNYSGILHYGEVRRLQDRIYMNSSLDKYGFVYLAPAQVFYAGAVGGQQLSSTTALTAFKR